MRCFFSSSGAVWLAVGLDIFLACIEHNVERAELGDFYVECRRPRQLDGDVIGVLVLQGSDARSLPLAGAALVVAGLLVSEMTYFRKEKPARP
jgi:hypothetical protein